jgi:hypothetical protein
MVPDKDECRVQYSDASWNNYWKDTCNKCYSASVNPNFTGNCDLSWNDISGNCYKFQLCRNREMATLANKQQNNNSGFDERYANAKKQYDYTVLETVNMVVGIGLITYLTVYSFSVK